jgi:superfamily I DNA/RNA helicase
MPKLYLRASFQKDLSSLRANHRANYNKVCALLVELETEVQVVIDRRAETRIPNCVKFELSDGYRAVLQKVEDSDALIALCVGKHDYVDSFLDGHKGWVFDPHTGRVKEMRLATVDEAMVNAVPSNVLVPRHPEAPRPSHPPGAVPKFVFEGFDAAMLQVLGVPAELTEELQSIDDPNSTHFMALLGKVADKNQEAANLLLSYATGDRETQAAVLAVARGERKYRAIVAEADEPALRFTTDEFLSFEDPREMEEMLEAGRFEQWQLFLHPEQAQLVNRRFDGPARIRGISGSGKTVVALHRARHLAKEICGTKKRILFTTFNKALARSASRLLDSLCGDERQAIEVSHVHKWCLDFIYFREGLRPRFSPDTKAAAQKQALAKALRAWPQNGPQIPEDYLWDEVEFIMGRFLHEERDAYLETDRTGRGRALTAGQRSLVLRVYEEYVAQMYAAGEVDPAEFVRIAFRLRKKGEEPEYSYAGVIVDEAQDVSETGLRLLYTLAPDSFLMVGDGVQRIFTKGYSLRGLGIDIPGRSIVLRKNYRNTRQILEAAFPLVVGEWAKEIEGSGAEPETMSPVFSVREGPRPAIVTCPSIEDESRFLQSEVKYLFSHLRYSPSEICIMARNDFYRQMALKALQEVGIPAVHYRAEADEPADIGRVRASSLHSGKGHEYSAVLIPGMIEGVFPQTRLDQFELQDERAVLYVGMTRARDIVYLSFSEQGDKGQHLQRSRFLDEIAAWCDELVAPEGGAKESKPRFPR